MPESDEDRPHHVEGWGRLPVTKTGMPVFLGERGDGNLGWSTGRPRPFPTRGAAMDALAACGGGMNGLLVTPRTVRVVPA
jgi:hypothetical protein